MEDSAKPSAYPGDTVKPNCQLTANLASIDKKHIISKVGADGITYNDVYFDLVVSVKSALMKFSLEIKGKEFGSVNAKYE